MRPTSGYTSQAVDWQNRSHFFAIAATVMRRVIIDYLRKRATEKRGADVVFVDMDDAAKEALPEHTDGVDWLALDQALTKLAQEDEACAQVVEMRIFSGLAIEEIATLMQSSTATVGRQWRFARNWLALNLGDGTVSGDG